MLSREDRIGSYVLEGELARGGMGVVLWARHADLGRRVAIKVPRPDHPVSPVWLWRFRNEARALCQVRHPGLVQLFEFGGLPDGTPFLVMEILEGESLDQRLQRRGRLELRPALRLGILAAQALAAAHEQGIIHMDLKPGNVFLVPDPEHRGQERIKLLDFGLCRILGDREWRRWALDDLNAGITTGTPLYMAPERCCSRIELTDRVDVYALGVMLFHVLTGSPPFFAEEVEDLMLKHVREAPPRLVDLDPACPVGLSELLERMLAKEPEERPDMNAVARELEDLEDLAGLLTGQDRPRLSLVPPVLDEPESQIKTSQWVRRRRWAGALRAWPRCAGRAALALVALSMLT